MNGWINGLTVYNVHVMFEISAKTIYEINNCIKTYERFIKIWLNKGHFSRTITQLLHTGQGYVNQFQMELHKIKNVL